VNKDGTVSSGNDVPPTKVPGLHQGAKFCGPGKYYFMTPSQTTINPDGTLRHVDPAKYCSCVCICDAITKKDFARKDMTIKLESRKEPGGVWKSTESTVFLGPGWAGGYEGYGDSQAPARGTVRATQMIILAHELCTHAVAGMIHPDPPIGGTIKDPVIQAENRFREEHNMGTRTGPPK
jgi:hypothetical protein